MDENAASIGGTTQAMPPTSAPQDTAGWIVPATATPAPEGGTALYEGVTLTRTLTYGMQGDDVKAVQNAPGGAGLLQGKIHRRLLRQDDPGGGGLSKEERPSEDGVVGSGTWNAMMGAAVCKDGSAAKP